jgi:hypothetical protein
MIGRSDKPALEALDEVYRAGYIDGEPQARRATVWRFVIDEAERARLRSLRTSGSAASPLRICGPSAEVLRTSGSAEVEGEETPSLSSNVVQLRGRGSEDIYQFKAVAS